MTIDLNNNPCISVIVPVYKAEEYLYRCVNSLLGQTFSDFEIILVDDGSPDNSGAICDEYALKDKRVRVIHQPNAGVSMARQKGLDNARGEYVIHADPDDWVEPDMLKELYAKAKEEDADMVICDFYMHYDGRVEYKRQQPSSLEHNIVLCELFKHLHGSCCNKLVRRACYYKFNVSFQMGISLCEDLLINSVLLTHNIRVTYLAKAFYHYDYNINPNSIVHKHTLDSFVQNVRLVKIFENALSGSIARENAKAYSSYLMLQSAFMGNFFTSKEYKKRCAPYIHYCFYYNNTLMNWCLYFSCLGFYKPIYYARDFLKKSVRLIVKIIRHK